MRRYCSENIKFFIYPSETQYCGLRTIIELTDYFISVANICVNDGGFKCLWPFKYKGKQYYDCTTLDSGYASKSWCYDVRENGKWDYCKTCKGIDAYFPIFQYKSRSMITQFFTVWLDLKAFSTKLILFLRCRM